jgi:thiamine pyrophosphokinase
MKKDTVLIVANGEANSKNFLQKLKNKASFVIGVDGGAGILFKYNIKMDVAIGDFDSIKKTTFEKIKKSIPTIKYPKDKDYSDTELAVRYALKKGFNNFILTGMGGKRTDHLLFNLSVLYFLLKKRKNAYISEENEDIFIVDRKIHIETRKGNTVSLYPFTAIAKIENTEGLKYPLHNKTVVKQRTLTLSNIAIENRIYVEVSKGVILLIVEKERPT